LTPASAWCTIVMGGAAALLLPVLVHGAKSRAEEEEELVGMKGQARA
jgi:hypothetical protein